MHAPADQRQALQDAIAELQARRAVLGDALVDAALGPLLDRLAALGAPAQPGEPVRRLRQVSVLFLDIVGSTRLVQHLDPEDVQFVVDGALAAFTDIVARHGGEVLRYAGDNLKAAFGADETVGTREDDAERAVDCGLALLHEAARRGDEVRRAHGGEGFGARVGIHTGPVVRGGGIEQQRSMSGLAVNIAARMEQTAPDGALRISQATWALVRGSFDAEPQPPLMVKGHDAPIASWLVRGAKPRAERLPARGIEGVETALVGRGAELARFQATVEGLLADGAPRALTLVAEAGLGKSRLLHEFQHQLPAHRARWWVLPARAQPSSALQPYGLLRDLLARRLEIADSDSADVARGKLVHGLAPCLAEPNDPAPELVGQIIGLDFSTAPAVQALGSDARLLRDRALEGLGLWLARLAASDGAPVVLLLDDLQWSDDASLDALAVLLQRARGPVLALLSARPGLIERRPDWGRGLPRHECITLAPLDPPARAELARCLLQRMDEVPQALTDLIEQRAEGNPFYAEELVGMLLDQGVITSRDGAWVLHAERLQPGRLPTTLVGVLQARLDALDADARHALQMASVIGPVFWDDALGALDARGPGALPGLQRRALVQPRPTSAFEDTVEESFQHHLLHQVSYDTVLKARRREAHARAAAWLTARVGERSDEYLGITAQHHERAEQHAWAADWYDRAAEKALRRCAYRAVLHYTERAEAQAALAPEPWPVERSFRQLARREMACDSLALRDLQAELLDRMLALAEAQRNDAWIAEALTGQTLLAFRLGHEAQAEAAARRGAEVAERADRATQATLCRGNLAWMAIERRDLDAARRELAAAGHWAALARARQLDPDDAIYAAQILLIRAELHAVENDAAARAAALEQALAIVATVHAPRTQCSCHEHVANIALGRAEPAAAAVQIDAAARLAAEFGLPLQAAVAQELRAKQRLLEGQWDAAARDAAAAASAFEAMADAASVVRLRQREAEALWRGGRVAEATSLWQQTAERLCERGDDVNARCLRLRLAEAQAATGSAEDLEAAHRAVRAELPHLHGPDSLAGGRYGLAARLSAWRVLQRAGDPEAAVQLALAGAELQHRLGAFADADVRARVARDVPWYRDVARALEQDAPG